MYQRGEVIKPGISRHLVCIRSVRLERRENGNTIVYITAIIADNNKLYVSSYRAGAFHDANSWHEICCNKCKIRFIRRRASIRDIYADRTKRAFNDAQLKSFEAIYTIAFLRKAIQSIVRIVLSLLKMKYFRIDIREKYEMKLWCKHDSSNG